MYPTKLIASCIGFLLSLCIFISCENPIPAQEKVASEPSKAQQDAACISTLERHLQAISDKDLESLKATLSPQGDMQLILPNSEISTTTEAFINMHEEWFQDSTTSWTFETKILHTDIGQDLGIAIVEVMYREAERNGKPYFNKMAVSYALRKIQDSWYVVKDHACTLEKTES